MRFTTLLMSAAVLGLVSSPASATPIQVSVPFEFVIGDKTLPPAAYIVESASGIGPSVLRIRPADGEDRVMFDTSQMPEKADPKMMQLVFDTVGETTYLTEVWGVTDSGRAVKHLVDGHPVERAPEASRRHVAAARIMDTRERNDDK